MPRRYLPSQQSRIGRPPLHESRFLSPDQIQTERLILAQDMIHLVLEDGEALPRQTQQRLRQISEVLGAMRRQARDVP